jgi:hypothetical protein
LVAKCQSSKNCFTCNSRHHTLLHDVPTSALEPLALSAMQRPITSNCKRRERFLTCLRQGCDYNDGNNSGHDKVQLRFHNVRD